MEFKIRNATLSDIPSLLELARHVGRYVCADELRTWLQIDSEALFVAEEISNGKLIGSCSGTRLSPDLGFMGFYIVLEEYRGKGLGSKMWRAAKEHLGHRNIGVRGDPVNIKKYSEKEGFCFLENYTIIYYECIGENLPTNINSSSCVEVATYFESNLTGYRKTSRNDITHTHSLINKHEVDSKSTYIDRNLDSSEKTFSAINQVNEDKLSNVVLASESLPSNVTFEDVSVQSVDGLSSSANEPDSNASMRVITNEFQETPLNSMNADELKILKAEEVLSSVVAYDKLLHKRDRSFYVRQTFSWATCRSKVALAEGKVVGYACLRRVVTEHWIISPFYADSVDIAEVLLFELLEGFDFSHAPKGIQIRFPDKNTASKRLVEKFGFRADRTHIMTAFTKQCINVDTSKIYSFHSTVFCSE